MKNGERVRYYQLNPNSLKVVQEIMKQRSQLTGWAYLNIRQAFEYSDDELDFIYG